MIKKKEIKFKVSKDTCPKRLAFNIINELSDGANIIKLLGVSYFPFSVMMKTIVELCERKGHDLDFFAEWENFIFKNEDGDVTKSGICLSIKLKGDV